MNLALAFVLMPIVFWIKIRARLYGGDPRCDREKGSPAEKLGFQKEM